MEAIPDELVSLDEKFAFIARLASDAGVLPAGSSGAVIRRLFGVYRANWQATLDYRPGVQEQDLTLVRALQPLPDVLTAMHGAAGSRHEDRTNGWSDMTSGRLHVVDVPGDHLTIMEEPYVEHVAKTVVELLGGPALPQKGSDAMTERGTTKALVIGAGIGGLACAAALRRVGVEVEVYERATELRAAGSGLSVMSNAVSALATLGIDLGLEKRGRTAESFLVMDHLGEEIRDVPFKEVCEKAGAPSVCLSRSALQEALLDATAGIPVHLGARATGFEADGEGVTVRFEDGRSARGDLLIGADGFHSAVRSHLVGPEESADSGYVCWLGLVPFDHPVLTPGAVRHYWGSGQRFGLIDIGHGRFYWWGTKNMPTTRSHAWDGTKDEITRAYAGWADEVRAVIEATPPQDILAVPSRDRAFLERWGEGPVTLLGDAAHPMLTTLGQGSAMAIEDAVVLAHTLAEPGAREDLPLALRTYEDRRRDRTRAMVAASRYMSDLEQADTPALRKVRDDYFRLTPREELARQNEEALTFPGVPGPEPRVRRPLSPLERWYWTADRTSPLSGIVRARVHGPLPVPLLRGALDALQARHPCCASRSPVTRTGRSPPSGRWAAADPLRHVVVAPQDPEAGTRWEHEVNAHELAERVDRRAGPLVRAVVITREAGPGDPEDVHDLLLTASHCVADGMTCLSLMREWIELAARLGDGHVLPRTSNRALPATEDLLPSATGAPRAPPPSPP
ncbi:FAD-dependent monooxygenase [Streptomyces stramineus]